MTLFTTHSIFLGFFSAINPYIAKKSRYLPKEVYLFGGRLSSVFDITTKWKPENFRRRAVGPITSNLSFGLPIEKKQIEFFLGREQLISLDF
jgi:hypothetical protein